MTNRSMSMNDQNASGIGGILSFYRGSRRNNSRFAPLNSSVMISGFSFICFGGEDWWYHHPHSKNHLMRRFARAGNKVIFVNSISMGMASVKSKDLVPRIARKLKSYAKLARTTEEGITVVSPAVIPFFGSRAATIANRRLLTTQIAGLGRGPGFSQPILWISPPPQNQRIRRLNEPPVFVHRAHQEQPDQE